MAWDAIGQQVYFSSWTSPGRIYRANADGSEVVTVLNSSTCKLCSHFLLLYTVYSTKVSLTALKLNLLILYLLTDVRIQGVALDFITTNLYGVTSSGYVFVCNTTSSELLNCRTLLSGHYPYGITLDSNGGYEFTKLAF